MFLDIRGTTNNINTVATKNITRIVDPVIEDREIIARDIQKRYVSPGIQELIINSLKLH